MLFALSTRSPSLVGQMGCAAVLESQDEIVTRKPKRQETESDDNNQALDDIGYDADLYISNQVVVQD